MKITIKFDNKLEGKADITVRSIIHTKENFENPFLLWFLGKKTNVSCNQFDVEYNNSLFKKDYWQASGFDSRYKIMQKEQDFLIAEVTEDFIENTDLIDEEVIFLRGWSKRDIDQIDEYPGLIEQNDFRFEIFLHKKLDKNTNYIFQFRFVLDKFIGEEICDLMRKSGSSWSFSININQKTQFKKLFDSFEEHLLKPDSIELWIFVPHGHTLAVVNPKQEKTFSLTAKDAQDQNQFLDEGLSDFRRKQGDLSIKFLESPLESENFMISCTSPVNIDKVAQDLYKTVTEPFDLLKKATISFFLRKRKNIKQFITLVVIPILGIISSLITHILKLTKFWNPISWILDVIAILIIIFVISHRKNTLKGLIDTYCGENGDFKKKYLKLTNSYIIPVFLGCISLLFSALISIILISLDIEIDRSLFFFISIYIWLVFVLIYSFGLETYLEDVDSCISQ